MNIVIITTVAICFFGIIMYKKASVPTKNFTKDSTLFYIILAIGVITRLVFATLYYGHKTDVTDFLIWSDMVFENGIPSFYPSDSFTDYPPGYMYVLWVIGFFKNTFSLSRPISLILIKLPSILADAISAYIIYRYAIVKKKGNICCLSLLLIFNPATILNSSLWGQVDSVMTLFVLLTILFITEKKLYFAYFTFFISVFIKPQAFIFTPLLIWAFFEEMKNYFSFKKLLSHSGVILSAFVMVILLSLPFGLKYVISQYVDTLGSYQYATVNAFNFWAALGQNWVELNKFSSITGGVFLILITLSSFYILYKSKSQGKYFFTGVFLCFSTFMLSVKMHERYCYPALILCLFAFLLNNDLRHYILYILLTAIHFFNTAFILFVYETDPSRYFNCATVIIASFINILLYLYMAYASDKLDMPVKIKKNKPFFLPERTSGFKLFKTDYIIMATITLLYSIIGFYALGDTSVPQTEHRLSRNEIVIEFEKPEKVNHIKYFLGEIPLDEDNILSFTMKDAKGKTVSVTAENDAGVFSWHTLSAEGENISSVAISVTEKLSLKELSFYSDTSRLINVKNIDIYPHFFDEEGLTPIQSTYMNSAYFDEVYHARTAYEFIHRLPVYEWTHPPLGKVIIALGIEIFGMTPFGWRFMGALFGVLIVPLIYILAKAITKSTWITTATTLLFTFDFMHFTQSRLATVDVFLTFFIMLMYYFMLRYFEKSFYDTPLKKTLIPLCLCGISTGLSISTKWNGAYACFGILIIFIYVLLKRYREYSYAKNSPDGYTNGIAHKDIIDKFPKYTIITLCSCFIFFIIIPVIIYTLSYIPYLRANYQGIGGIIKNQVDIFTYHAQTVVKSTHPYSSPWYTWPVITRPVWYYSQSFLNGTKAGISAMGNPLVWWVGIASFVFCFIEAVFKKDKCAIFLVVAYLSNFLPWSLISRTTFIYHYFPSVPFVVLMIGYTIMKLYNKNRKIKKLTFIYVALAIILFIVFFPVISGAPTDASLVRAFLRWLPGWVLI